MSWNHIEENWSRYQHTVSERWKRLTPDDLAHIGGKRDHLEGRLQAVYGISRDEVRKDVDEFCHAACGGTSDEA